MPHPIAVIAPVERGAVHALSFEMLTCASALREIERLPVTLLAAGTALAAAAESLARRSGLPVTAVDFAETDDCGEDRVADALAEELRLLAPAYVLLPHTTQGVSLAGALATVLKAACITGVEEVVNADGRVHFTRPVHGGKFMAQVASEAAVTVLTIPPGAFLPAEEVQPAGTQVTVRPAAPATGVIRRVGSKPSPADTAALADARVIVAAGRGIGDPENLHLVKQLAARFAKSAVAGSRVVCDLGWLPYSCQVGATGMIVSPELYIACGISGAVQHVMGMRSSKFVVAINTDPNAAIFREADVCVVENVIAFIPTLLAELESAAPQPS